MKGTSVFVKKSREFNARKGQFENYKVLILALSKILQE